MKKNPWMKYYPSDWRSDAALRTCSLAARGLWIEMLGLMHESPRYGHLVVGERILCEATLAALVAAPTDQVAQLLRELEQAGVFAKSSDGAIYSRRMVRDYRRSNVCRKNVKKRWNLPTQQPPDVIDKNLAGNTNCITRKKPEARGLDVVVTPAEEIYFAGNNFKLTESQFNDLFRRFSFDGNHERFWKMLSDWDDKSVIPLTFSNLEIRLMTANRRAAEQAREAGK